MVIGVEPNENPPVGQLAQARCVIGLSRTDLDRSPIAQFQRWFNEVIEANLPEPNAMTLATSTPQGGPSARIVLLKAVSERDSSFSPITKVRRDMNWLRTPGPPWFLLAALRETSSSGGQRFKTQRRESEGYFHSRQLKARSEHGHQDKAKSWSTVPNWTGA